MKKIIIIFFVLLPLLASAEAVEIGGIYYNLISKANSAEVTHNPEGVSGSYSGDVIVPDIITYEGKEYSVTGIGDYAFYVCRALTSITIPNSVKIIGASAFDDCDGLSKVNISDLSSWCEIKFFSQPLWYAKHLYIDGKELKDMEIPFSVTNISSYAFQGCEGLTSVVTNSVTSIGEGAFYGCKNIKSLSIGNNVTNIENFAFFGCSGITSIMIPSSVSFIGWDVFSGCTCVKSINVEKGNKYFDSRNDCNAIIETQSNTIIAGCMSTIIPNTITKIGYSAFSHCSGLTTLNIPSSVEYIGDMAISYCDNLKKITIGKGVTHFDPHFIYSCPEITDVYCYIENLYSTNYFGSGARYTYEAAFGDCKIEYATLHVPKSEINNYKKMDPWKNFGNIVPLTSEELSVKSISNEKPSEMYIYTLDGTHINKSKKGLNIIKYKNGCIKKKIVK